MSEISPILFAVLLASLAGSGHCVGMCGPFVILASGGQEMRDKFVTRWGLLLLYHAGRGLTYLFIGFLAGMTGMMFNWGGTLLGLQQTVAWITGLGMMTFGSWSLIRLFRGYGLHLNLPIGLGPLIRRLYRSTHRFSGGVRSGLIGLITGWLPCGWLYAFVLLAVSTAHPLQGGLVLAAFWIGTLPALSLLAVGFQRLTGRGKIILPYLTACLLIFAGFLTVSLRANADLSVLDQQIVRQKTFTETLESVEAAPLPCCQQAAKKTCCPQTADVADESLPILTSPLIEHHQ